MSSTSIRVREQRSYQPPRPLDTVTLADVLMRLPRLRCGACRGRIVLSPPETCDVNQGACSCSRGYLYCYVCGRQYNDVAHRLRSPLPPSEMEHPKRGRPPKPRPVVVQAPPPPQRRRHRPVYPCADCAGPATRQGGRCHPCAIVVLAKWPTLVDLLADGLPMRAGDICEALGISHDSLRQYVHKARCEGHVIRTGLPFGTYRLERTP